MRLINYVTHLFMVFSIPLFSLASLAAQNKEVIIAGDNWCPINCNESEVNQGYMIDVAKAILQPNGYKVTYVEMPWTRAVGLARSGKIHAIVGAFVGDAPDFVFPKTPLLKITSNNLFVAQSSAWQYQGLASLNEVRIGVIKGYDYGTQVNNYINSLISTDSSNISQLYGNDAVERNIQFLLRNRVDVILESAPVFWYHAYKMSIEHQVKEIGAINPVEPCYIAFSPSHKDAKALANMFDKGVQTLIQNKALAAIAKPYGLPSVTYMLHKKSDLNTK